MQAVFYHVSCAENIESCGQTKKYCFCNKNVLEFVWKHFCFSGSKILFLQQCFPRWAKLTNIIGNIMFVQQCFLVCEGRNVLVFFSDKECDEYIVVWLFDAVICTTLSVSIH